MTLQRSRVTLAQILAAPVVPQSQTHPPTTTVSTAETPVPTHVTRAGLKRLRGSNFEQPQTIPDSENSPPNLSDTHVDVMDAPAYIKAFMVDEEALPATDRVRPWRDGRGGKVAECVGKALLLPEDMKYWAKWDDDNLLLNMKREAIMGYQCSTVIEERFLAVKAKANELNADNEDLLKKFCDTINKVSESKKLRAEAEEKAKAISERKEALEKELEEMKKALAEKDAELKGYVADDEARIQDSYKQGQLDCISSEVQQNLQVYFLKGWFAALDKMKVDSSSSLRQKSSIPIPEELIIIPITRSGGEVTNSAAAPTTEELPRT